MKAFKITTSICFIFFFYTMWCHRAVCVLNSHSNPLTRSAPARVGSHLGGLALRGGAEEIKVSADPKKALAHRPGQWDRPRGQRSGTEVTPLPICRFPFCICCPCHDVVGREERSVRDFKATQCFCLKIRSEFLLSLEKSCTIPSL